jgi:phospholipase/carboxylesterase
MDSASAPLFGGLEVVTVGAPGGEPGGTAVVLLHGWGAPGDDLVALAEALQRPRTRFFMPAGPLPERGGGRAWWHLDLPDRPMHARGDDPPGGPPHPALLAARTAVQGVLRTIRERHQPERLVIAGFSQGGMLALDVALTATPPVDRVAVLSGLLMADSLPALRAPRAVHPPVFVAHGRDDQVVPVVAGELARALLEKHGFTVTWRPFGGGHGIPAAVVTALGPFLFGS